MARERDEVILGGRVPDFSLEFSTLGLLWVPRIFGSVKCCHHFQNWLRFLLEARNTASSVTMVFGASRATVVEISVAWTFAAEKKGKAQGVGPLTQLCLFFFSNTG